MLALLPLVLAAPIWAVQVSGVPVDVELSADGKTLGVAAERTVTIFRRGGKSPIARWEFTPESFGDSLTLTSDGTRVAIVDRGTVKIYDVTSGRLLATIGDAQSSRLGGFYRARFSPDGRTVAAVRGHLYHNWLQLFDARTGKARRLLLDDVDSRASDIQFSTDGQRLAIDIPASNHRNDRLGRFPGPLTLLDVDSGRCLSSDGEYPIGFRFDQGNGLRVLNRKRVFTLPEGMESPVERDLGEAVAKGRGRWVPRSELWGFMEGGQLVLTNLQRQRWPIGGSGPTLQAFSFAERSPGVAIARKSGQVEVWPLPKG
jgi:hypothetical protein